MDPLEQLRSRFTGLRLQEETTAGKVYAGQDADGTEVTIAVLTGQAASDPEARGAFADVVWQHSVGAVPGRATVTSADLHAVFPWAAARTPPGGAGAEQLLARVVDRPAAPATPPPQLPARVPDAAVPDAAVPDAAGSDAAESDAGVPDHAVPDAAALVLGGQPPEPVAPSLPATPPEPVSPLPILPGRVRLPVRYRLARLSRSGSPWPWLLGAAGGVLLVLIATAVIGGVQALRAGEEGAPGGASTGAPQVESGQPPGDDPDLPQLRTVEPVAVLGPTFAQGEPADTMAFVGWPFAFRTPPGWECFEERLDEVPAGEFYRCEGGPGSLQEGGILLWECVSGCAEDERQTMLRAWLQEPEFMDQRDGAPTYYVETGRNPDGLYTVSLGHFAAAEPGGPPRWLIGVYVESPVESRAEVQKILNDVVSQATV